MWEKTHLESYFKIIIQKQKSFKLKLDQHLKQQVDLMRLNFDQIVNENHKILIN